MAGVYQVFRNRRHRLLQLENPQPFFQLLQTANNQPWKSNWNPAQFQLKTSPKHQHLSYGHLSFLMPSIPLIHEEWVDAFAALLTPYGELLPMLSEHGIYYAYHALKPYDALDWERSIPYRFPDTPSQVDQYEFLSAKIQQPLFFRLPHSYAPFFATESFVEIVNGIKAKGWQFEKCWENRRLD